MPNAALWDFWKTQGAINDGIEIKAKFCTSASAKEALADLGLNGTIWTHDRQLEINPSRLVYEEVTRDEDGLPPDALQDEKGIYTIIELAKS